MSDKTELQAEISATECLSSHEVAMLKRLVMHSVSAMFDNCGNSYANRYTELWLTHAKKLGVYHGNTIGTIDCLKHDWEMWIHENGGLPNLNV